MTHEKIIILDFGSQYTQLIARRVRELNIYCEIYPFNKLLVIDEDVKAVILSGSPFSVRDKNSPVPNLKNIKGKKVGRLVKIQIKRAQDFYTLAIDNLPHGDKKTQKPGLMMGNIYYVLLSKIYKDSPENILNQKTTLSNFRKFLITLLTFLNYKWIK